jgi:hypothetical protein
MSDFLIYGLARKALFGYILSKMSFYDVRDGADAEAAIDGRDDGAGMFRFRGFYE